MKEYKSRVPLLVKNSVFGVLGGGAAGFALGYIFGPVVGVVAAVVLAFALLYFSLYQDNIAVTLDDERLCVWRFGKKLADFPRDAYRFEASLHAPRMMGKMFGGASCVLYVAKPGGKPQQLDCSMLGRAQFTQLLHDIAGESGSNPGQASAAEKPAEPTAETADKTDD